MVVFDAVRWAGLAAGLAAAALVYVDAARRDLARPLALALLVGTVAAAGFLAPSLLYEAAYRGLGRDGVLVRVSGRLFAGMFLAGAVTTAGAVLVYGLAARLRTAPDRP